MEVEWIAFPLHPETPPEGRTLDELFAGSTVNIPQMLEHLKNVADSLGLPFGQREKTYNSRLAQELGLWAESEGKGNTFHMAAFHAYFADGKNLAEHQVLLNLVHQVNLDVDAAETVLQRRSFSPAVDAHWQLSRQKGVTAVPTFIINNSSLTGARPFNDLLSFVRDAGGAD